MRSAVRRRLFLSGARGFFGWGILSVHLGRRASVSLSTYVALMSALDDTVEGPLVQAGNI